MKEIAFKCVDNMFWRHFHKSTCGHRVDISKSLSLTMVNFFDSECVDMVMPYGVANGNARFAREL